MSDRPRYVSEEVQDAIKEGLGTQDPVKLLDLAIRSAADLGPYLADSSRANRKKGIEDLEALHAHLRKRLSQVPA